MFEAPSLSGMSMPYGIAVDSAAEQVYWTDFKAGRIQRLSLRCANGILEVPSRMNSTMVKARSDKKTTRTRFSSYSQVGC